MSRYPVRYYSASKRQSFDIEDLNDFHLVAAHNKLVEECSHVGMDPDARPVLNCLKAEISLRKLDPRFKGGKPPEDPPPTEAPHDVEVA